MIAAIAGAVHVSRHSSCSDNYHDHHLNVLPTTSRAEPQWKPFERLTFPLSNRRGAERKLQLVESLAYQCSFGLVLEQVDMVSKGCQKNTFQKVIGQGEKAKLLSHLFRLRGACLQEGSTYSTILLM